MTEGEMSIVSLILLAGVEITLDIKVVPVHTSAGVWHESTEGRKHSSYILKVDTIWRWGASFMHLPLYSCRKSPQYSLNMTL
jgi:hypothetical protein